MLWMHQQSCRRRSGKCHREVYNLREWCAHTCSSNTKANNLKPLPLIGHMHADLFALAFECVHSIPYSQCIWILWVLFGPFKKALQIGKRNCIDRDCGRTPYQNPTNWRKNLNSISALGVRFVGGFYLFVGFNANLHARVHSKVLPFVLGGSMQLRRLEYPTLNYSKWAMSKMGSFRGNMKYFIQLHPSHVSSSAAVNGKQTFFIPTFPFWVENLKINSQIYGF